MADKFTPEKRSLIMSRIQGKNTSPEIKVRSMLHAIGVRFRIHYESLPGKPDICLPKHKTAVFVNGCYWHRHKNCPRGRSFPKSNKDFWKEKFNNTIQRDKKVIKDLRSLDWRSLIIWECELKRPEKLRHKLMRAIRKKA